MQLNKTKSKIRRSLGGGGLNTIPPLNPNPWTLSGNASVTDLTPLSTSFLCAHSCSPVVSVVEPLVAQMDNIRQFPGKYNVKNLISSNEPNFKKLMSTLTHEITRNYNRSPRNHHPKNEPKANPIRTQNEPNTNPIRTQLEPNRTQFQRSNLN